MKGLHALWLLPLALGWAGLAEANPRARANQVAAEVTTVEDVEAEIEFGRDVAARILARYLLGRDEEISKYVALVGKSVAMHGTRPELQYYFGVIESDTVNAYAAPGGYIFVTTGSLALMSDEAELAAVLAHEIAHVNERHIVRELNIKGKESGATAGLARVLGASGDPTRVAFKQAVDEAISLLFEKGLKQADELQADSSGLVLLAATGYDPAALRRYLDKVRKVKGEQVRTVESTHPPFSDRLAALDKAMAEAGLDKARGPTVTDRFQQHFKKK